MQRRGVVMLEAGVMQVEFDTEHLRRVLVVRKTVDNRDSAVLRKICDIAVLECSYHYAVDHS